MAKRTTIIDIGSNSMTLVIYEKSSRFAFHLIEKVRSSVRIGENAYSDNGELTPEAMDRAFYTLQDFMQISKSYKARKVFCVATSALRDAPNRSLFVQRVRRNLKLNIKVIDGTKEAYYGALAALNLLPPFKEAVTVDIGGGSTELAKIKDGKIVDTISLNVGTVRLKELFFDRKKGFKDASKYVEEVLSEVPSHFRSDVVIGIGGTIRALSKAIMREQKYPIDTLHAFEYKYDRYEKFIKKVAKSPVLKLKDFPISSSRYDTIREGSTIFYVLNKRLKTRKVVTSKAGVREGVYLHDILRNTNYRFPHNFNVSIKSLLDRFALLPRQCEHTRRIADEIYGALCDEFDREKRYRFELLQAAKLVLIFNRLNIYSNSDYSFFFLLENLNFSLSHKSKLLIAILLRFSQKGKVDSTIYKNYKKLLPDSETMAWLTFIITLSEAIIRDKNLDPVEVVYDGTLLTITSERELFLAKEIVKKIKKPKTFAVILKSKTQG
ncbi:MAG: Ppx/GppA family phosphatase [Sulfurospirillum sp.]|nr:MAG: Ppx/GppA family phosphatase [Sulfurospirillum sp.]